MYWNNFMVIGFWGKQTKILVPIVSNLTSCIPTSYTYELHRNEINRELFVLCVKHKV